MLHAVTVLGVHMQEKCALLQLQTCVGGTGAKISLIKCTGHKGMDPLMTIPRLSIKAAKCTNCSGCQECRQPVPLVIPEGTGGSGCPTEVAAKAEALQPAGAQATSDQHGHGPQQQGSSAEAAGQADPGLSGSASGSQARSDPGAALVECAVCHRRPGEPGVPATLKLCGGCKMARYCSTECQSKDWKMGHKELCQAWAKAVAMQVGSKESPAGER
jgi:hypothetical protein